MPSAAWSLQKAVFAALAADAPLIALLGAARIYDDVPQSADFPYLTFGQSTARDWSTASEDGSEHTITLNVWSQAKGRNEVHEIMAAARSALHGQPLTLEGHRLINLRHEFLRSPPRRRRRDLSRHRPLPRRYGAGMSI